MLDFTSRVITGACKKISDHELKDCSFFFHCQHLGHWCILLTQTSKRTMETVQMKQIWCYNLRGLYYEAGLQAKPGSCRVFFSMLQRYFALGQIITETYPADLTCSRKQPHALRSQCIKFLVTIFAFPPPSSIRNMDS